jgi:aminotransferase
VGQRAALAALRTDPAIFDAMALEFRKRCEYAYERLSRMPGIAVKPPAGSFYIFPRVHAIMPDCERFAMELLDQEQVVTVPGSAFGPSGEGFVRLACTVDMDRLREAMDRMERFVMRHMS